MPMDGLTLSLVTRELREALVGGRVDRITQPERDELNILVRNHGRNQLLLLSASAGCARAPPFILKQLCCFGTERRTL